MYQEACDAVQALIVLARATEPTDELVDQLGEALEGLLLAAAMRDTKIAELYDVYQEDLDILGERA